MYYNIRNKRILIHFLVLMLFAVMQGLFTRFFDYFWGNINIAFVYFIFLSFYLGKSVSYKIGFCYGILLDCFGATYGFYAFIFTVIGYVTGLFSGKFYLSGILLPVLFSFTFSLIYFITASVLLHIFFTVTWSRFLINAGIQLFFNILLSPLLAFLFRRYFFRRVGIVENGR